MPRVAPSANDNQKREEPESSQQLRNVKRDSIEEEFQISQNGTRTQGSSFGVNLRNGTNLVLWHSDRTGDSNIYGRCILPNDTDSNNEFVVNQDQVYNQYHPSVVELTSGPVLAAWDDYQTRDWNIFGRFIFSNRTFSGNEFRPPQVNMQLLRLQGVRKNVYM